MHDMRVELRAEPGHQPRHCMVCGPPGKIGKPRTGRLDHTLPRRSRRGQCDRVHPGAKVFQLVCDLHLLPHRCVAGEVHLVPAGKLLDEMIPPQSGPAGSGKGWPRSNEQQPQRVTT